jgi:hypothetical protein
MTISQQLTSCFKPETLINNQPRKNFIFAYLYFFFFFAHFNKNNDFDYLSLLEENIVQI